MPYRLECLRPNHSTRRRATPAPNWIHRISALGFLHSLSTPSPTLVFFASFFFFRIDFYPHRNDCSSSIIHIFGPSFSMARGPPASSPPTATPPSGALKRSTSSTQNMKNQKSILGFFQKSSPSTPSTARNAGPASSPAQRASEQRSANGSAKGDKKKSAPKFSQDLAPVPSSDLVVPEEEDEEKKARVWPSF